MSTPKTDAIEKLIELADGPNYPDKNVHLVVLSNEARDQLAALKADLAALTADNESCRLSARNAETLAAMHERERDELLKDNMALKLDGIRLRLLECMAKERHCSVLKIDGLRDKNWFTLTGSGGSSGDHADIRTAIDSYMAITKEMK
jgi:hypothetical protein